jgi:hypothetical protein
MAARGTTSWPARYELASPVRWNDIAATVRAIAASSDSDFDTVTRLVVGLTEPMRQLDNVAALTVRALANDAHGLAELKGTLAGHHRLVGALRDADDTPEGERPNGCGCDDRSAAKGLAAHDTVGAIEGRDDESERTMLDESDLMSLALAVAWLHGGDEPQAAVDAVGAVVALAAAATPMAGLVDAWQREGELGVASRIEAMGMQGQLSWLPPAPMLTMSGSLGGFGPGGIPGLPGGGIPGVPGGGIPGGDPGLHFKPPKTVNDILDLLKPKHPGWDPENWCPVFPWWHDPFEYIDWRQIRWIACVIEMFRQIKARAAILPPQRPARVTWSDGITSIEQAGSCAGNTVIVRGTGFPSHTKAVLLIPTADGCRPVTVTAANWTSKKITFKLPGGVASGPIGFGDAAYIAAYDAWAAEQNRLADEIRALGCFIANNLPWMPPFRECPPATAVNRIQAGAPIIDAFTANGSGMAVVEPGVGIWLAWTVRNTTQVRIDRVSASGPTFAGSTALVNPGGTAYLLSPPSYAQPQEYRYRLTVTGPCGTETRDVTVVASRRPGLTISGVEVTQSIQNTANTVRLVESKPTVVRVTVRHSLAGFGTNVVNNVRGRIRVRRANGSRSGWFDAANGSLPMAANPGASINVVANPQRNNTNDTLNFLIPPFWNQGTVSYEIEARVAGYGAAGGFAGFDGQASWNTGSFTFQHRRTLEFRWIRVNWGGSTPTNQVCLDTLRGAVPLLPTPTANISALAGVGIQTPTANASGQQGLLDDFDDRHNCSVWEALTEWLGSDCPDEDGTIWILIPGVFFRGKAYDIPSNVCFTPPSDGPYAAHELSHCLDQTHVGLLCSNGQQASGGDPASAWPNNAQLVDVPFDVVRNVALSLSGTGVFDVMTYCGSPNNTWPMPARWDRLWDQVGG